MFHTREFSVREFTRAGVGVCLAAAAATKRVRASSA